MKTLFEIGEAFGQGQHFTVISPDGNSYDLWGIKHLFDSSAVFVVSENTLIQVDSCKVLDMNDNVVWHGNNVKKVNKS